MKKRSLTAVLRAAACAVVCVAADSWGAPTPPRPRSVLVERLDEGIDVYGIVHWGLNTYTDREWGYGDENPALLAPEGFDADQIVGACKDGGLRGLVVVAKHHDGFCLWPTKTTAYNVSQSPFRAGKGDYVKEMADACRRAGLKFGVYCSPWDRNSAHYATETYVNIYHAQLKELLDGRRTAVRCGLVARPDILRPGRWRGLSQTRFIQETTPQALRLGGTLEAGVCGRRAGMRPLRRQDAHPVRGQPARGDKEDTRLFGYADPRPADSPRADRMG